VLEHRAADGEREVRLGQVAGSAGKVEHAVHVLAGRKVYADVFVAGEDVAEAGGIAVILGPDLEHRSAGPRERARQEQPLVDVAHAARLIA
jgi:hypothetical protein